MFNCQPSFIVPAYTILPFIFKTVELRKDNSLNFIDIIFCSTVELNNFYHPLEQLKNVDYQMISFSIINRLKYIALRVINFEIFWNKGINKKEKIYKNKFIVFPTRIFVSRNNKKRWNCKWLFIR